MMSPALTGVQRLRDLLAANRRGERAGVTSICSAEPFVLEAAAARAARGGGLLCIESTANQVNQDGGYTGMTPANFRDVGAKLTAAARELVRGCVLAGYTKLHLDASMACADDPAGAGGPLDDETATARAADLCRV